MKFWLNVLVTANGHWLWTGSQQQGYGQYRTKDTAVPAHRRALELFLGRPLLPKHEAHHKQEICRITLCVNPEHLEELSQITHKYRHKNNVCTMKAMQTHCKNGHEFTKKNTLLKMDRVGRSHRTCRICASSYRISRKTG